MPRTSPDAATHNFSRHFSQALYLLLSGQYCRILFLSAAHSTGATRRALTDGNTLISPLITLRVRTIPPSRIFRLIISPLIAACLDSTTLATLFRHSLFSPVSYRLFSIFATYYFADLYIL
jgi:hypothetical protein